MNVANSSFLQGLMLLIVGGYLLLTALGFSIKVQLLVGPFLMLYGLLLMTKKQNPSITEDQK